MRFIAKGPIIPDQLLEERDRGQVVFLCGAGVSVPAGMPTFLELARFVIERLSPARDSDVIKAFTPWREQKISETARTPLDQIFNLLQSEYGRDQVDSLVHECLSLPENQKARTVEHEIISKISANQDQEPQIVTTNFDHLFERVPGSEDAKKYLPPSFPDLRYDVPVTGITYLHGRLSEDSTGVHDYVLSSSDFGRAYLAQGWATEFIRQLLKKYTVVLLGYQAEDPPVKYLLQGLKRDRNVTSLYVFEQGKADEIETKWRDRGVIPIAYPKSQKHQALWDTLDAWAKRSDDPTAWKSSIISLAKKKPGTLSPHERGAVAHIVRTAIGAKQFAEAEPSPPIEWLFVFDRTCRFGRDTGTFDPLAVYGLDDDPPRPPVNKREDHNDRKDLIAWYQGDNSMNHTQRLAGGTVIDEPMPSRLSHLSKWILKHLDQPALAWWAARQYKLHPRFYDMLRIKIEGSDEIPEVARRLWVILIETLGGHNHRLSEFAINLRLVLNRLKISGWNSSVIRAFESATEPKFKISQASKPPTNDWSKVKWNEIADIDLRFPPARHDARPEIPDKVLPLVYSALQRNLTRASERLREAGCPWFRFRLATFYPEKTGDEDKFIKEQDAYVKWFLELFDRMAVLEPKLLRAHVDIWPNPDKYFFDKLRLYAWNKGNLFSTEEVSENILGLRDNQFWRPPLWWEQRELLFLLRDRWSDFSHEKKERISKRILEGGPKNDGENEAEYCVRRDTWAALFFGWLAENGCEMPEASHAQWLELKNGLPQWRDTWIRDAASSGGPTKTEWVKTDKTDKNDAVLKGIPEDQIVDVARKHTRRSSRKFTKYKPFCGLVENNPTKALSALLIAAQRDDYPIEFWDTIVSDWPDNAPTDETKKLYESMGKLPPEIVFEIRWAIHWFEKRFPEFAKVDDALAFSVFDDLVEKLLSCGPKATKSSIGETRIVGGEEVECSRKTMDYAIDSPLGMATEGLISVLAGKELQKNEGLPDAFKVRVERLLAAPGEGPDHTVYLLARQTAWLNYLDPDWVSQKMIPWFDLEHPFSEPAWSGILKNDWTHIHSVFPQIKTSFLDMPTMASTWKWGRESPKEHIYAWIVQSSLRVHNDDQDDQRLTFD